MEPVTIIVIIGIILLVLVIVALNIKIVPQSKAYVMERLGAYSATWETGFHIKIMQGQPPRPSVQVDFRVPAYFQISIMPAFVHFVIDIRVRTADMGYELAVIVSIHIRSFQAFFRPGIGIIYPAHIAFLPLIHRP